MVNSHLQRSKHWLIYLLLGNLLAILLAGCSSTPQPAEVAADYVAACESGDHTKALAMWVDQLQGFAVGLGGNACNWVPDPATSGASRQVAAEMVTDTTARVTYEWGDPATETRHIVLSRQDNGEWRVFTLERE